MDKFIIIIIFYVIAAMIKRLSSTVNTQIPGKTPGVKTKQTRLKPEDLQRIARQRQQKQKPLNLSAKPATPPPLPDLPTPFFDAPPDEEAAIVDEELPEALEASERDMMTPEISSSSSVDSSLLIENLGKNALQGIVWSEILRPPVSMRR